VIGGGPAGLMAAEVLSQHGVRVDVYDAMPSVGRKFLMAGKGGMNITHAEPFSTFLDRYGVRSEQLKPMLESFSPETLREWIHGLGIATFVGTSGRVFPADMKAAPLLRAWLHRLRDNGVRFHMRHQWLGWNAAGGLCFATPEGECTVQVDSNHLVAQRNPLPIPLCADGTSLATLATATSSRPAPEGLGPPAGKGGNVKTNSVHAVVLALGGGSWPQLGSNGAWLPLLQQRGVKVAPLRPANCGFDVGWSEHFRLRFAGQALKAVVLNFTEANGVVHRKQGDCMVTEGGIEGGLVYALSAYLRDTIESAGSATIYLDLTPGKDLARVQSEVSHPRGSRSISSHLKSRVGLKGVEVGLLRECVPAADFSDPLKLARAIKSLPLQLIAPRPLREAISSAGGVVFESLDEHLMLRTIPGVFCAGEMLDWEAPTGGYLLTACFASGRAAGEGVLQWLKNNG
jgi:predicted flavoprotein YhiN